METTALEEKDATTLIKEQLDHLKQDENAAYAFRTGNALYINGQSQVLTQSHDRFEISVDDQYGDYHVTIEIYKVGVRGYCDCKSGDWCHHKVAGLLQVSETLTRFKGDHEPEGKAYTREGMIKRVLEERAEKACNAKYHVEFADNIYGEHFLINDKGKRYKLTFRDFEKETGYCSCPDHKTNKLGTCKHLMFAFNKFKKLKDTSGKSDLYPFVEVYLDPLNEYRISWFYPHELPENINGLIREWFGNETSLDDSYTKDFLNFVREADQYKQVLVREEVLDKIEEAFDDQIISNVRETAEPDYSVLKADLYPYQKEGVEFAAFRKGAVIADEMGLGKTLQAIGAALMKKAHFGFSRTLVITPASLKHQWKKEIEQFTDEEALIVEGHPSDRRRLYSESDAFFQVINYERVLQDLNAINQAGFDYIILDEGQRIKNYDTITANSIKSLHKKHALAITGTPLENKLIELYSIVKFVDPNFLPPLWEFSHKHCYFAHDYKNKITGYYNLQELKEHIKQVLIRREKQEVMHQLNNITEVDVPTQMHEVQEDYHASGARAVASILRKKFKTPYDMRMLTKNLQMMRMACDSSYLVDKETNHSPKLDKLEEILLEKLDLPNNDRKVIIFSEWKRMIHIISKLLSKNGIGFAELSGEVPVSQRSKLIEEFENNPDCRAFISTESGGSGLNLQAADTVINFELPWNPAKKNQRIGRIDRIGQETENLTVINLITKDSIEMKIASGLVVKQNLFDSVLNADYNEDIVDFSEKGRAQFLQQLEEAMADFEPTTTEEEEESPEEEVPEAEAISELAGSDERETVTETEQTGNEGSNQERIQQLEEMESVMQQGLNFLSSMYKMSTGKELPAENQKVEVDKETGEVVMRFKLS